MRKRTLPLDQLDLIAALTPTKTENYRVSYRVESLPDGRLRTYDYRHLPLEKRPMRVLEVSL